MMKTTRSSRERVPRTFRHAQSFVFAPNVTTWSPVAVNVFGKLKSEHEQIAAENLRTSAHG